MLNSYAMLLLPLLSVADVALDILRSIVELPETIFSGYSSFLRWAAESVHSLFEDYGYWVVFLGTMAENTLLLGLVIPGLLVVVLAGLASHEGAISFPLATALGIAGTIIGDTISYFMGRFGWARLGQTASLREFSDKVREPLLRRGALFVLVYHFAGYTRVVGPASAGLLRMPYRRWAPADYAGASLWVLSFMSIGYGLGALGVSFDTEDDRYFRYIEWGLLALVMIWGYFMLRTGQRVFIDHQAAETDTGEKPSSTVPTAAPD
jgi:membrane protein DedA with SNARE-associated domain